MAHHSRVRAPGTWTTLSAVLSAEFEALDLAQFGSIDGDTGGTWAPSGPIIVGGSGVQVTGAFTVSGFATFTGAFSADSVAYLNITDEAYVEGFIEFENGSNLQIDSGATVSVAGNVTYSAGASVWQTGSTGSINSGATFTVAGFFDTSGAGQFRVMSGGKLRAASGGTVELSSGSTLDVNTGATVTLAGATTQTGMLTRSGSGGRTRLRSSALTTNADNNIGITADVFSYLQSGGASGHTLTALIATGSAPQDGEVIHIIVDNADPATVTIKNEGSANYICRFGNTSSGRASLVYQSTTSRWRLLSATVFGAGTITYDQP